MTHFIPSADGSEWQGNWIIKTAKDAGIRVFYVRGCYGDEVDEWVESYTTRLRNHGLAFGLYGWFRPDVNPTRQANLLHTLHRDLGANLIPESDVEDDGGGIAPRYIRRDLRTVVNILTTKVGKPPVLYTSKTFWDPHVNSDQFGECPLWVARYVHKYSYQYRADPVPFDPADWGEYAMNQPLDPGIPLGFGTWDAWQFSAGGNGCGRRYGAESNDLDLNIIRPLRWHRFQLP